MVRAVAPAAATAKHKWAKPPRQDQDAVVVAWYHSLTAKFMAWVSKLESSAGRLRQLDRPRLRVTLNSSLNPKQRLN